jgi:hypothetical protein
MQRGTPDTRHRPRLGALVHRDPLIATRAVATLRGRVVGDDERRDE